MSDVGRPSLLTPELTLEIRGKVLDSVEYKTIQEIHSINPSTWDSWVYFNTNGFRDLLTQWKHERIVKKAEANLESLMNGDDDKIRADLSKFALERLNKKSYASKSETDITSGGRPIIQVPIEIAKKNNIDATDTKSSDNS